MIKALILATLFAVLFIAGIIVSIVFDAADKLAAVLHKDGKVYKFFRNNAKKICTAGFTACILAIVFAGTYLAYGILDECAQIYLNARW